MTNPMHQLTVVDSGWASFVIKFYMVKACIETNRIGIGVEIDKKYCDLAIERLKEMNMQEESEEIR